MFRARLASLISSPRSELVFVGAVVFVAAFLRFYRIGEKSIWLDEAFSVWVARHSLWEGWSWLIRVDQHPPLHYSLLHLWIALFGEMQGAVRALSALASTLTVPIFYAAARRLLDRPAALIAVTILAISPFHIQFAQEARMYALLTLEVACVLYFLSRLLTRGEPLRRDWIGLAVAQGLVMLTHNSAAVYLPLALNTAMGIIFLFSLSRFRKGGSDSVPSTEAATGSPAFWKRWLSYQGLAVLVWLPWAVPFVIQVIDVEQGFWLPPPWPELFLNTFRNFHFAFMPSDLPLRPLWMWAYPVLALAGLVRLLLKDGAMMPERPLGLALRLGRWRWQPSPPEAPEDGRAAAVLLNDSRAVVVLLVCLFALPHIIALLVSLHRPIYAERPLIWTTLPYFLMVGVGIHTLVSQALARLPRPGPGTEGTAAVAERGGLAGLLTAARLGVPLFILLASLTISGFSLHSYYFWYDKEDWEEATTFVGKQVKPGDLIVFNAPWVQLPFEYYYRRFGLDTELRGLPVNLLDLEVMEPIMTEGNAPYIHQLIEGRARVWLVYSHEKYADPAKIIPREMGKALLETERARFVGLQVIRYEARDQVMRANPSRCLSFAFGSRPSFAERTLCSHQCDPQ